MTVILYRYYIPIDAADEFMAVHHNIAQYPKY